MAIVFAAIVPHPPLLIPSIGKEHSEQFATTRASIETLARELYTAQPDVVVVLSPHGSNVPEAICLNVHAPYVGNFTLFGDLVQKPTWSRSDAALTERLRHAAKIRKLPVVSCTEDYLDYGSAIPLTILLEQIKDVAVLPVLTANHLPPIDHFSLGGALRDPLLSSSARIALIASVDLSHRVSEASPEGFSPSGVAYDEQIREMVAEGALKRIIDIPEELSNEAKSCASRPLALFAGLLEGTQLTPRIHSYEPLFGTGYLVAQLVVP